MNLEPVDGPILLTAQDLAELRLVLSTYQDGTGMLAASNGRTLPGGAILKAQWQEYLQVNPRKVSTFLMWYYQIPIKSA